MVMNKKGFLKILESIIAIVIVLSFVISIMPITNKDTAKTPPDLEQTTTSILQEVQSNPKYRQCVITNNASCIQEYINFLSYPIQAHPWNYSIKICKINYNSTIVYCSYNPSIGNVDWKKEEINFVQNVFPSDKDVYTKDVAITVPDVSSLDLKNTIGNYTILTIYAWSKY